MATLEKRVLVAADFRLDPILGSPAARTRADARSLSAHRRAQPSVADRPATPGFQVHSPSRPKRFAGWKAGVLRRHGDASRKPEHVILAQRVGLPRVVPLERVGSRVGEPGEAPSPAQLSIAQDGRRRTGPYGPSWIVMFPWSRLDVANGRIGQEGGVVEVGVRVKPIWSGSLPGPGLPLSVR